MDCVYSQSQRPVTDVEFAAIAVKQVSRSQRHVGLLYRANGTSDVMFLHLAWHHDLRNGPPGNDYLWVAPRIPKRRLQLLAARCRQVFRKNPIGIPYGFSPPNYCIDKVTGEFLIGPTRHGLTCATFVLAVFESIGLNLLRYETWPVGRGEDLEWQNWVISALEGSNLATSPEHLEAVRNEVGGVRIRPEDVAGAATISSHPADFSDVSPRAAEIVARLQSDGTR